MRAEEALRRSEARLSTLVSVITDVPWTADPGGAFTSPQPAWAVYTGQSWDEHRGFGWMDVLHPDDRREFQVTWKRAAEDRAPWRCDGRLWHAGTRQYRYFEARAAPVVDGAGAVREWVGTCTDIHERMQLERDRERLLESERAARTEAERSTRLKEEFLSTVSHELRTPLNVILGWVQLIHRRADADTLREGLDAIERGARVQAQLIEELLDVSRIASGKLRLELKTLELDELVDTAVDTLRASAESKGIEVIREGSLAGPIRGDPARLQQVVWNLLSNAIKFTSEGGTVRVGLSRRSDSVEISVSDNGAGIPEKFLPHLFERFRQADSSSTRAHGGLGLGLSIVKHLVELHGGAVEARSDGEGRGAAFTVRLPVAVAATERAACDGAAAPGDGAADLSDIKVLVVDDDPDSCEVVRRILADRDAQVSTALSADEALSMLEGFGPDVLVSDIGMPGKDGLTFIRQIREREMDHRAPRLPAVALTAFAREEDRVRALQAGYSMHVAKPVEARELVTVIASLARER
jgi:PAS domain S-box-containing protein